jgi:hypothetical protein
MSKEVLVVACLVAALALLLFVLSLSLGKFVTILVATIMLLITSRLLR